MKKAKSIWIYIFVIVLSVAMMLGSTNLVALADTTPVANGTKMFAGNTVTKVRLGESFDVPQGNYTVTAPNGTTVIAAGNRVVAEQLGNYVVTYTANVSDPEKEVNYSYNVYCYEEKEYFLYVADNGTTIPSYLAVNGTITLPDYYLAYEDEDGKIVKVASANQSVDYSITSGAKNGNVITATDAGTMYLTLNACIGSFATATKIYSQEFQIKVQPGFEDTVNPTLTVVNVPTKGDINSKVTLPVASATDDFDSKVYIEVTVTDPNGEKVKEVEVNDYDYATETTANEVKFDNKDVVDFYPTMEGSYKVSYKAIDDAGNESATHNYYIDVADKLSPVIVDINSEVIPTAWGLAVTNEDGDMDDTSFVIPMPTVIDNATATNDIALTVEIKNTNGDSEVTIAKFSDTIANYMTGVALPETYEEYFVDGTELTFTQEGLRFDFNDVKFGADSMHITEEDMFGEWQIVYSVKDAENNTSASNAKKTFTINLSNSFEDKDAPSIDELVLPKYIMVGANEDEFVVPSVVASDSNDTALNVSYVITSDAAFNAGNKVGNVPVVEEIELNGGETFEIVEDAGVYYIKTTINNAEVALKLDYTLTVNYSAIDDAGNRVIGEEKTIDVLYADAVKNQNITVDMSNINTTGNAGEKVNLGSFTVSNVEYREYTGFEVVLKDYNGEAISGLTLDTYYNKLGDVMHVENINFQPAVAGIYELYISVFDVTGNTQVYAYAIDIQGNSNSGVEATAEVMPTAGSVRTSYNLKHNKVSGIVGSYDDYVMVYRISGAGFRLMGYEFTALYQGKYSFTESYKSDANETVEQATYYDSYSISVDSTESPVIEVQGVMPSYSATTATVTKVGQYKEGEYVELPAIVAFNEYENAEIEVLVTDPDKTNVKVYAMYKTDAGEYTFEKDGNKVTGQYAFSATKNGTYTVTVNAYTQGSSKATRTYSIAVGDVTAPIFTVVASSASNKAIVGDKFVIRNITDVRDDVDVLEGKINVTVKLYDPSSSSTAVHTVNKTWVAWKNDSNVTKTDYTFTKSGTYTVEYTISDSRGNSAVQKYTITVSGKSAKTPISTTALSTVLIIVAVALIAIVVLYFVRFRKVKK